MPSVRVLCLTSITRHGLMESRNAGRDIEPAEHLDHIFQQAFTGLDAKEPAIESKFPVIPCMLLLSKSVVRTVRKDQYVQRKAATKFGLR